MGCKTDGQTHAKTGKCPPSNPMHKPSHLANVMANVGRIDSRTLVYVLLIIVACALVIVAIAAVSQMLISSPSAVSSLPRHH